MSTLSKAIKAFCVPKPEAYVCGDGRVEKIVECPAWPCQEGVGGTTKEDFKHGPHCPVSLLKRLGDTQALHKELAVQAHYLDYEGGGHSSCPICKGPTGFRAVTPKHVRNCPGSLAHRTAQAKWFLEAAPRA